MCKAGVARIVQQLRSMQQLLRCLRSLERLHATEGSTSWGQLTTHTAKHCHGTRDSLSVHAMAYNLTLRQLVAGLLASKTSLS